jgi:signal transduction histidine kinase
VRLRLVVVLTIPIVILFLVLGAAHGRNLAHSAQLELFLDRFGDISHFVPGARQALGDDDPVAIRSELERYGEVYGVDALLLDRTGDVVAGNGIALEALDEPSRRKVEAGLSGRSSGLPNEMMLFDRPLVVAEPVFEGGDLVGAVVTSSGTEGVAREVLRGWAQLLAAGLLAVVVSVFLVSRLAHWVLRPVRMVDTAMTEVWHGNMDVRISETGGPPELRRMIAVFNGMAQEVERLIQHQQEFVSNASHELRNPLNALLLRVEHLGLGLPDEWQEEMDLARDEGARMGRILDALLVLVRGERGIDTAPVELTALVARRLEAWQPQAHEHDVELAATPAPETWCELDEIMLESAFDAVLDNAVKFSPSNATVEVAVHARDGMAEISVRDQGPGLEPHELERITQRFWRSPRHQNRQGSGLGLAIATEFLRSCDGELAVAPANGEGLAVSLRVPCAASQESLEAAGSAMPGKPPGWRSREREGRS